MKGHPAIVKKSFANRPSQADQKYVFTKDGRKVRNIAYNPQFEKLSYNTSVLNLPNKTKDTYIDTLDGVTRFFDDDGELHRDDGPAVEYASGSQEYWRHGKLHRDGGPALVYADGSEEWY